MKAKKIVGLKGILCRSVNGAYFIRARKSDGSEQDYDIAHSDLLIEVTDEDAYIYRRKGHLVIDHSPATLGVLENKSKRR